MDLLRKLFEGRLNRISFIVCKLISLFLLVAIPLIYVGGLRYFFHYTDAYSSVFVDYYPWVGIVLILLWLPIFVHQASVIVRRLHDLNVSGYWYFIFPGSTLLGPLVVVVWIIGPILLALLKGSKGSNKFGKELKSLRYF